jgi:hypothetical protein
MLSWHIALFIFYTGFAQELLTARQFARRAVVPNQSFGQCRSDPALLMAGVMADIEFIHSRLGRLEANLSSSHDDSSAGNTSTSSPQHPRLVDATERPSSACGRPPSRQERLPAGAGDVNDHSGRPPSSVTESFAFSHTSSAAASAVPRQVSSLVRC